MISFIAKRIMEAADKSIEDGIAKYRAYFVRTRLYQRYRADVDSILIADGYEEIVVEDKK